VTSPFEEPAADPAASLRARKLALRDQLQTARNRLSLAEVGRAAEAITRRALAEEDVRRAASVAVYVSIGTEPGTGLLLEALADLGRRVLLPLTVRDEAGHLDLDWAVYAGPDSLAAARFGLLEPVTPALGREAVGGCDVVLAPAMAVDDRGYRMGKGAGCYDRALGRVPAGTPVLALLYDDEVGRAVPVEPHDRPVTGAVTPSGVVRFR
jgi:5-formyltetrahydrofolate cyclo-ligase